MGRVVCVAPCRLVFGPCSAPTTWDKVARATWGSQDPIDGKATAPYRTTRPHVMGPQGPTIMQSTLKGTTYERRRPAYDLGPGGREEIFRVVPKCVLRRCGTGRATRY